MCSDTYNDLFERLFANHSVSQLVSASVHPFINYYILQNSNRPATTPESSPDELGRFVVIVTKAGLTVYVLSIYRSRQSVYYFLLSQSVAIFFCLGGFIVSRHKLLTSPSSIVQYVWA